MSWNVTVDADKCVGCSECVDVCPVDGGYVMTAAFSLSDRPLNTWQGNMVLWQRVMLAAIGGLLLTLAEYRTF